MGRGGSEAAAERRVNKGERGIEGYRGRADLMTRDENLQCCAKRILDFVVPFDGGGTKRARRYRKPLSVLRDQLLRN